MHIHVGNRSLDQLRCEEGYRGWLALQRLMPQIKDIQGYKQHYFLLNLDVCGVFHLGM